MIYIYIYFPFSPLVIFNFDLSYVLLIGQVHTTWLFCALVAMPSTLWNNGQMSTSLPEIHRVIPGGRGGGSGGGTPRKVGWGVQPIFQHPSFIYDRNLRYSQPHICDLAINSKPYLSHDHYSKILFQTHIIIGSPVHSNVKLR